MAIQGLNQNTFSFTAEYQKQILSAMIQKPKLFERIGLAVDPNAFEIKIYKDIFKTIKDYYSEYKALPGQVVLNQLVSNINDSEDIKYDIEDIYNDKLKDSDIQCIEKSVSEFVDYHNMKNFFMTGIDYINDPDKYTFIKTELDKVLAKRASMEDNGIDVYSDSAIIDRWEKRQQNNAVKIISSGWNNIDEVFGGGFESGTITSFMACANVGKSFVLVNIGANMLLQQKNVLHISLEMSEESVMKRYDSRLLGLNINEIKKANNNTMVKLQELLDNRIGKLFIKQYPAITITAVDINAFIERLETVHDLKIDALIVDYADIMKSASSNHSERRFELEKIYMELRNVALERQIPIITATQLSREGLKASKEGNILDSSFIAESYGIARHLDNSVTINATPADIVNHTMVFYISKNRQGQMGQQIRMFCDFSKALVKEWSATEIPQQNLNSNNEESGEKFTSIFRKQ